MTLQPSDCQILFPCRQYLKPTGGVQVIYRHVDILNHYGFNAAIVHGEQDFRCHWFENQTRILYEGTFNLGDRPYVVVPEVYELKYFDQLGDLPRVIFNQNAYYSFDHVGANLDTARSPYLHPNLAAVFTASADGMAYLSHAFPHLRANQTLFRLHYSIDPQLFYPAGPKKKQLCFLSRKNYPDALQVLQILSHRQAYGNFRVYRIDNTSQSEVARIFRESAIFLSFGGPEGFGLPVAEAMACGCLVVGYHGGGGRELFDPAFSWSIPKGEILSFAQTVEALLADYQTDSAPFEAQAQQAAEFIANTYSPRREVFELISAWVAVTGCAWPETFLQEFAAELVPSPIP